MSIPSTFRGHSLETIQSSAPNRRFLNVGHLTRLFPTLQSIREFYFPPVVLNDNLQRVLAEREFTTLARRTIFWFAILVVSAGLVCVFGEAGRKPPILFPHVAWTPMLWFSVLIAP
jgi:hypothetical protein